ncbi:Tma64 protein [Saccharomycopsis crataegensis]|uniref:Tma64 protein n=1 Tax=Saccharomycopsis crataegensis TaxID=43959 RepID=A0AAV5QV70_9ASCO|nr:Tma64 protein [Saccharomycopsis crataegensis]
MFAKDPGLKALANIKSSQRRKLGNDVAETYRVAEPLKPVLAPSSVKSATYKSPLGHSGTIFTDEESIPIYFKTKDSVLMPTVYTLWRVPGVLPVVLTNSYVIKKIEGGANLMLPGTIPPFDPRCVAGSVVGIASYEEPLVIMAVGTCQLNLTEHTSVQGKSGIAVNVLHYYGDHLSHVSKKNIRPPTNEDLEQVVESLNSVESDESQLVEGTESLALDAQVDNETSEEVPESDATVDDNSKKVEEDNELSNNKPEEVGTLSTTDIDYLFKRAFLMTLYQEEVKPPVSATTFVSNFLLKNLPYVPSSLEHVVVMKKTSWKKSAKFFKEMEKAKYLKLKGKDDNLTIIEVVKRSTNEEVRNFVPHKIKKPGNKTQNTSTPAASGSAPVQSKSTKGNSKLNIIILHKPNSKSRPFFDNLQEDFNHYYSPKDLTTLMNAYIAKNKLVNPKNKKMIILNDFLNDLINGGNPNSRALSRDKIVPAFLKYFTQCYKILPGNVSLDTINLADEPPIKGTVPKIQIVSEYKLGRKIITRTSNFEKFGVVTPDALAQYLRVKCSGSTTIGTCKENPKLAEVTVQGPHIKIVTEFFMDKGISASYIESTDKTKSNKKR